MLCQTMPDTLLHFVIPAGEFVIVPDAAAPAGHRLAVDNNSGTYAPPAALLPHMRALLEHDFPGLVVETVAVGDLRLEELHRMCPSRLAPPPATAAAAAAAPAGGCTGAGG